MGQAKQTCLHWKKLILRKSVVYCNSVAETDIFPNNNKTAQLGLPLQMLKNDLRDENLQMCSICQDSMAVNGAYMDFCNIPLTFHS